jgi:salicylate hydroxylase
LIQHGDRVEVQFHNGATADADVVVGADGIHSTVREATLGPESPRFSGHVAYRGLVPAARIADLGIELVASSWWGPDHHFVRYFVGAGARYLKWVAITPGEWRIESWTARGEVADALKEFEGWHPQVRAIIGSVYATNRWALYDRDPLPRWMDRWTRDTDGRRGARDASLHGARCGASDRGCRGACKCLEQADAHDADAALRRYEQTHKPRASRCQEGSRRNGVMYHLADGEDQRNRDANLASATTVPVPQNRAWLYGHDVEAEFEQGVKSARAQRIMRALLDSHFSHSGKTAPL